MSDLTRAHADRKAAEPVSLVERLDPALGEATSGLNAILTEMTRRTLRGGVSQVQEQFRDYVVAKVNTTLRDQQPAIEQSARQAASELVTTELTAFDEKVTSAVNDLSGRVREVDARAQEGLGEAARHTAGVEHLVRQTTRDLNDMLIQRIEQVESIGQRMLAETASNLERQLNDFRKDVVERQAETLASLRGRVDEIVANIGRDIQGLHQQVKTRCDQLEQRQQDEDRSLRASLAEVESRGRTLVEEAERHAAQLADATRTAFAPVAAGLADHRDQLQTFMDEQRNVNAQIHQQLTEIINGLTDEQSIRTSQDADTRSQLTGTLHEMQLGLLRRIGDLQTRNDELVHHVNAITTRMTEWQAEKDARWWSRLPFMKKRDTNA